MARGAEGHSSTTPFPRQTAHCFLDHTHEYQSEHPDFMPADGAAFVASKIDAIAANPDVWAKTAFILDYDENDGIFDHVAPPVPAPGTPHEFVGRAAHRRRIPGALHYQFLPGPPAAGFVANVGSHFGASISRRFHRHSRTQHQRLAEGHLWEPDVSLPFPGCENRSAPAAGTSGTLTLAKYLSTNLPKPVLPGDDQHPPKQERALRKRVSKG